LHPWNRALLPDAGSILARACAGAELLLIEADQGLYDHYPESFDIHRTVDLLTELETPVVLVIDAGNLNESITAIVKGAIHFDSRSAVCGVVLFNSSSEECRVRQERAQIRFEEETGIVCLGVIPASDVTVVDFSAPDGVNRTRVINSVELVERFIDLDRLHSIARSAPGFVVSRESLSTKSKVCRIGVTDDAAFNTMFQENLDLLRREGAELVPFSLLSDAKLPQDVRGLYLATGPVERFGAKLQENQAMRDEIRTFAQSGGAIYAEGGSLVYLGKDLTVASGKTWQMAGVIPLHSSFVERFQESAAKPVECRVVIRNRFVPEGMRIRGFQFERFALRLETALPVSVEGYSLEQVIGGPEYLREHPPTAGAIVPREKVFGSQFLLNWLTYPRLAENFIAAARS
jgi:cobyrinic acid a,c-diamide synthase